MFSGVSASFCLLQLNSSFEKLKKQTNQKQVCGDAADRAL